MNKHETEPDGQAKEPPKTQSAGTPPQTPAQIVDALQFVEVIREQVIHDVKERDAVDITTMVFEKIRKKLEEEKTIPTAVAADVTRRIKTISAIAVAVAAVVSYFGITKTNEWLLEKAKAAAEKKAQETIDRTFTTTLTNFQHNANAQLAQFTAQLETARQQASAEYTKIDNAIRDLRRTTEGDLTTQSREAQQEAFKAKQDVKDAADNTLREFKKNTQDFVNSTTKDVSDRVSDSSTSAKAGIQSFRDSSLAQVTTRGQEVLTEAQKEIDARKERALKDIEDRKLVALQNLTRADSASGKSDLLEFLKTVMNSGDSSEDKDFLQQQERLLISRDFTNIVQLADKQAKASQFNHARGILDPIICAPEQFAPEVRNAAVHLLLDANTTSQDKRVATIELAVAAARSDDQDMASAVRSAKEANAFLQLQPSNLLEFSLAALGGSSNRAAVEAAFDDLDLAELSTRGLANCLIIAKRSHVPTTKLKPLEDALLRGLAKPVTIDRPSDYVQCKLYIQAFQERPVFDVAGVSNILNRIEKKVFPESLRAKDPWHLLPSLTRLRADLISLAVPVPQ